MARAFRILALLTLARGATAKVSSESLSCESLAAQEDAEAEAAANVLLQTRLTTGRGSSSAPAPAPESTPKPSPRPKEEEATFEEDDGLDKQDAEENSLLVQEDDETRAARRASLAAFARAVDSRIEAMPSKASGPKGDDESIAEAEAAAASSASGTMSLLQASTHDDHPLWPVFVLVNASRSSPANDPIWATSEELIRKHVLATDKDAAEWKAFCDNDEMQKYSDKGCQSDAAGSTMIGSVAADAYYCGNQKRGIDWNGLKKYPGAKISDLCNAEVGTAYSDTGVCGRMTKKELVLNFFDTVHLWSKDPFSINIPSIDCILGLGDCDIYYCHHCAGRCD